MEYHKTIILKDGRACTLRNGTAEDGQALLKIFNLTHTQTDYLLTGERQTVSMKSNFLHLLTARSLARPVLPVLPGRKRPGTERSLASVWTRRTGVSGSGGR